MNSFDDARHEEVPAAAGQRERIAALDLGSNSFHLLIVEVDGRGRVQVVDRAKKMVRLGAGTLRDGVIAPEAFERGLEALRELAAKAALHRPVALVAVGTSALREASNGPDFVAAARHVTGIDVRLIDGLDEARLIYLGARQALDLSGDRRVALFDVGGGSTEAILGGDDECLYATSMKIGTLRLRDRWPCSDPVTDAERRIMADWCRLVLAASVRNLKDLSFDFVALTSGTALALAKLGGDDKLRLSLQALRTWEERLAAATSEERVSTWGVDPGRADTIVQGAIILRTILELAGVDEALVCSAALREGIVAEYLVRRDAR